MVDRLKAIQVCKSKVKYYNEKSARRAQKALSIGYETKFDVYRCGESKHFHLTHADKSERIGHGNQQRKLTPPNSLREENKQ